MSFCRLSVSFCVSLVFCRCVSCRSITTPITDIILDFHRPDRLFFCDIDGSFAVRQDRCGGSRCFGGFGVCRIYRRLLADLPSDQYDAGDRCLFEHDHQRRHNGLYQLAEGLSILYRTIAGKRSDINTGYDWFVICSHLIIK